MKYVFAQRKLLVQFNVLKFEPIKIILISENAKFSKRNENNVLNSFIKLHSIEIIGYLTFKK